MDKKINLVGEGSGNKNTLLWLIVGGFFVLNITADHVFYKTNTLKLFILLGIVSACFISILYAQYKRYAGFHHLKYMGIGLLPILATLPGVLIYGGEYGYARGYELVSQVSCVLFMYFIFLSIERERDIVFLLKAAAGVILYVCLVGFLEKLGLNPQLRLYLNPFERIMLGEPLGYRGFPTRIESTFGNINYFAGFLIQVIPICLAAMLAGNWRPFGGFSPIMRPVIFLIAIAALLMTGTRAAIVALGIALSVFVFIYISFFKKASWKSVWLYLSIGVSATLTLMALVNMDGLYRLVDLLNSSAWQSRIVPWNAAYESIKDAPVFGYGVGASYELFFQYADPASQLFVGEHSYNHVHMELLEVLQEGGVFGLIAYLVFWFFIFKIAFNLLFATYLAPKNRVLILGLITSLVAFHIHGLFSVAPRMISVRVVAYGAAGLILGINVLFQNASVAKRKLPHLNAYVAPAALLVTLTVSWLWLAPYLMTHHLYSRLMVDKDLDRLTQLAIATKDLYVLDTALSESAMHGHEEDFRALVEAIESVSPLYRDALYYSALEKVKSGDMGAARETALKAQGYNLFERNTMALLTYIALVESDEALFLQQFKLAVQYHACKAKVIEGCEATELSKGQMSKPMQFIKAESHLEVYIDDSFLVEVRELILKSREGEEQFGRELIRFSQEVGHSSFFIPRTLLSAPSTARRDLQRYLKVTETISSLQVNIAPQHLSLVEQIRTYWLTEQEANARLVELNTEKEQLEQRLYPFMDIKEFMYRRQFLQNLTNFFLHVGSYGV